MTTTITIDTHQSPTSSSRSNSRSNSFTDEGSSGTGVHVSPAGSHEFSNQSDESWEGVSSEIDPSDSASRHPNSNVGYRDAPSRTRPPPASRAPTRRHTTHERTNRRPPPSRVHRHPVPAPPSSVDLPEDFPGYGRGYPTPQPGPYGARMPPPGYAQSAYSAAGPYAPPFAGPGALTHYGAPAAYQYPPGNPFSPQPTPAPVGGAGYFGAPHHPMSGHSTPGGYDMMQYPPNPGYGGGYGGYGPHGAMGGHNMPYYPPWPPSEGSVVAVPDPETERKLQAVEELMKAQKIEYDKVQKELADRAEKEAKEMAEKAEKEAKEMAEKIEKAQKELAERAAKAQKELDERNAKEAAERAAMEAARKSAEEKAAWEKKLEQEKKQALADFEEAQRNAIRAAEEQAKKAADEKAAWERKVEEEKKQALLDFEKSRIAAAEAAAAAAAKAAEEKALWERRVEEEKKQALLDFEKAQKAAADAAAAAAAKAAAEKAAWDQKLKEEREAAMAKGAENAKKAAEAEKKKAEEAAAEAAAKAAAIAELEKVKKEAAEEAKKIKEEAAEEAKKLKEEHDKAKKEAAEALAKALAPPGVEKKKPVKFKDAVGRKFSFPFELCATWAGMEELIRQAFVHVETLGPQVLEGHYDLIGPNGEIILPRVWETTIEPDWSISMHMWPMPELPKPGQFPPGGPGPGGHRFHDGHGRPGSRHAHHRGGPIPGPPPSQMRGGPPPPPPANWPGGPPPRPGPPPSGAGPGGPPVIVNLTRQPPGSRSRSRRNEPAKGVLGWMAGTSTKSKSSGKGAKKAELDPCVVM